MKISKAKIAIATILGLGVGAFFFFKARKKKKVLAAATLAEPSLAPIQPTTSTAAPSTPKQQEPKVKSLITKAREAREKAREKALNKK